METTILRLFSIIATELSQTSSCVARIANMAQNYLISLFLKNEALQYGNGDSNKLSDKLLIFKPTIGEFTNFGKFLRKIGDLGNCFCKGEKVLFLYNKSVVILSGYEKLLLNQWDYWMIKHGKCVWSITILPDIQHNSANVFRISLFKQENFCHTQILEHLHWRTVGKLNN